ncbi:histidine kinase [Micromonospora sp. BRA006-A]|nr:histidine kinase [Micromonospora sp. BRA006-A]
MAGRAAARRASGRPALPAGGHRGDGALVHHPVPCGLAGEQCGRCGPADPDTAVGAAGQGPRLAGRRRALGTSIRAGGAQRPAPGASEIERDLHDGAQLRLVNATLLLQMARQTMRDTTEADAHLDAAVTELAMALTELRLLSRGMRPPALERRELHEALAVLTTNTPVTVRIEAGPAWFRVRWRKPPTSSRRRR